MGDKNPFLLVLQIEAAVGLTLREVLRLDVFVRKFVAVLMGGEGRKKSTNFSWREQLGL